MFGFSKKKKKVKSEKEAAVSEPVKKESYCPIRFVRRVDEVKSTSSNGDDEWRYSDTNDTETYDIVASDEKYYFVKTHAHYYHSYDYGESPMNTYNEYTNICICEIPEDKKDSTREELEALMQNSTCIWDKCDREHTATEHFVCCRVDIALMRAEEERMIEELKKSGEAKPNAVYISYNGTPSMIYIHDFETNAGLARALDCDAVKVFDWEKTLSYFYNAKVVYGLPYNRVASSYLDASLEGAVVICGYRDGKCVPLDNKEVVKICNTVKRRAKIMG